MANKIHIDNWINRSQPDYYTMFIKAWIPLNAWYFKEYNTTQDKEALKQIKGTANTIRDRIEALLKNTDKESISFRSHLAHLQKELDDRTIRNYGNQLSFKSIKLDEYFPDPITDFVDNIIYKIVPNKNTGYKVLIVAKDASKTYMDKTISPYSLTDLVLHNQYISLPNKKMQIKIKELFEKVNPDAPFNLIESNKNTSAILLDKDLNIRFKNDTQLIAKALVQILYELRCLLFHGILDPTESNQEIYEHAYFLLKPLIKELK